MGSEGLPRGAHVRVRLGQADLITLEVSGTVIERLDQPIDEDNGEGSDDDDGEDAGLSTPLALAIDVNEPAGGEAAMAPAAAS